MAKRRWICKNCDRHVSDRYVREDPERGHLLHGALLPTGEVCHGRVKPVLRM